MWQTQSKPNWVEILLVDNTLKIVSAPGADRDLKKVFAR